MFPSKEARRHGRDTTKGARARAGDMHTTSLKTAYVRFRLPSLVERAHIPRESISARLPVSPLHSPIFPRPPHRPPRSPASSFLHGTRICPVPRSLIYTSSWVLHLLQGGTVHHRVPPLRAERCGMERCGRPPLMNVI